jgi:hypothetical protein
VGKKLRLRNPPVVRASYEPEIEKRAASPFATAKTKSMQSRIDAAES